MHGAGLLDARGPHPGHGGSFHGPRSIPLYGREQNRGFFEMSEMLTRAWRAVTKEGNVTSRRSTPTPKAYAVRERVKTAALVEINDVR